MSDQKVVETPSREVQVRRQIRQELSRVIDSFLEELSFAVEEAGTYTAHEVQQALFGYPDFQEAWEDLRVGEKDL